VVFVQSSLLHKTLQCGD